MQRIETCPGVNGFQKKGSQNHLSDPGAGLLNRYERDPSLSGQSPLICLPDTYRSWLLSGSQPALFSISATIRRELQNRSPE
jgi:hypothetical protein